MVPETLDALLAPSSAQEFLETQWGKMFAHFPGEPGKFSGLLPWDELNRLLRQHRLDVPRLRLVRDGKPVPADAFLAYQTTSRKPGTRIPRVNSVELTRLLRQGATLIVDAADELYEPVTTLAENLESLFRVRIQANLYAGWRTSRGFDIHWDNHDVIVVQVSGRKRWKVYGMTRPFPLDRDVEPNTKPQDPPLWEGDLSDGDLLYIPRGWWHVAIPLDEPTLHLTLGVHNPRGGDLLSWFADRLRSNEDVRRDLPRFDARNERMAYMERLREAVLAAWKPEMLEEFFAHRDLAGSARPQFGLPWSATEGVLPESGFLKWASPRPVKMESRQPGEFSIACNGKNWRFAEGARSILEKLMDRKPHAISELENLGTDPKITIVFLRELVSKGLVSAVSTGSSLEE